MRATTIAAILFAAGCVTETVDLTDPIDACRDLEDAICWREVECGRPGSVADCAEDLARDVPCGDVVDLGDRYADCMDAVPSTDCWEIAGHGFPLACNGVLIVR